MFTRLLTFLLMFEGFFGTSAFTFNKCCDSDSLFNADEDDLKCETSEFLSPDDLSWFPFPSVLDGASLLAPTKSQQKELERSFVGRHNVKYGFPECFPSQKHSMEVHMMGIVENFNVVLGEHGHHSGVYVNIPEHSYSGLPPLQHGFNDSWLIPFSGACFDIFDPGAYVVMYCPTEETPWIPKCCPARHLYNVTTNNCTSIIEHQEVLDWRPQQASSLGRHYLANAKIPGCEVHGLLRSADKAWRCRGFSTGKATFLSTGAIKVNDFIYTTDEYCGEKTWHEGNILLNNIIHCGVAPSGEVKTRLYGVLFIVGGLCLLVTVGLSLWLPELRRSLHNRIALTHNATLMVAYFVWGSMKLTSLDASQCVVPCLMIQFTFLASLFWLNAMCIDMSSTFRTTRLASRGSWRRYIYYSAYAWGLTSLISVITISMEFVEMPPFGLPRPGFACYCDFARHTISPLIYFYGPMAILLVFNLVLYVFTAWKIMSVHRQTAILHHTDSNATGGSSFQNNKQRLIVYTKLFLLMGLTWMTEIIGWAVEGKSAFWVVLDVINLLRAVLIFVLFICKRPVFRSIHLRLKTATGRLRRSAGSITTDAFSISTTVSRKVSEDTRDVELKDWRERKMSELKTLVDVPNEELKQDNLLKEEKDCSEF